MTRRSIWRTDKLPEGLGASTAVLLKARVGTCPLQTGALVHWRTGALAHWLALLVPSRVTQSRRHACINPLLALPLHPLPRPRPYTTLPPSSRYHPCRSHCSPFCECAACDTDALHHNPLRRLLRLLQPSLADTPTQRSPVHTTTSQLLCPTALPPLVLPLLPPPPTIPQPQPQPQQHPTATTTTTTTLVSTRPRRCPSCPLLARLHTYFPFRPPTPTRLLHVCPRPARSCSHRRRRDRLPGTARAASSAPSCHRRRPSSLSHSPSAPSLSCCKQLPSPRVVCAPYRSRLR